MSFSEAHVTAFGEFGMKYGNYAPVLEAFSHLDGTFNLFRSLHSNSLGRLKQFRDTIGAHSDSKASLKSLPSLEEFEALYEFANDFYRVISGIVLGVEPARVPQAAGKALLRIFESVGVSKLDFDFRKEK